MAVINYTGGAISPPTEGSSITLSYSNHSGVRRKLIAWASGENLSGFVASACTFNGISMTRFREDVGGFNHIVLFYLDDPFPLGTYDLVATFTGNMAPGFLAVAEFENAAPGDPTASGVNYVTNSSSNNTNLVIPAANSYLISACSCGGPNTYTPNSGQTLRDQANGGSGGAAACHGTEFIASPGSEASNWNFGSTANRFLQTVAALATFQQKTNVHILGAFA